MAGLRLKLFRLTSSITDSAHILKRYIRFDYKPIPEIRRDSSRILCGIANYLILLRNDLDI